MQNGLLNALILNALILNAKFRVINSCVNRIGSMIATLRPQVTTDDAGSVDPSLDASDCRTLDTPEPRSDGGDGGEGENDYLDDLHADFAEFDYLEDDLDGHLDGELYGNEADVHLMRNYMDECGRYDGIYIEDFDGSGTPRGAGSRAGGGAGRSGAGSNEWSDGGGAPNDKPWVLDDGEYVIGDSSRSPKKGSAGVGGVNRRAGVNRNDNPASFAGTQNPASFGSDGRRRERSTTTSLDFLDSSNYLSLPWGSIPKPLIMTEMIRNGNRHKLTGTK
jgi:hypothetical protein